MAYTVPVADDVAIVGDEDVGPIAITLTAFDMANTAPVADDVATDGDEDAGLIAITLTAFDTDDADGIAAIFRLNSLPLHGTLFDQFNNPVTIGDDYVASNFDIGLGRWTLPLYFVPDANWSGGADFSYISIDSDEDRITGVRVGGVSVLAGRGEIVS